MLAANIQNTSCRRTAPAVPAETAEQLLLPELLQICVSVCVTVWIGPSTSLKLIYAVNFLSKLKTQASQDHQVITISHIANCQVSVQFSHGNSDNILF